MNDLFKPIAVTEYGVDDDIGHVMTSIAYAWKQTLNGVQPCGSNKVAIVCNHEARIYLVDRRQLLAPSSKGGGMN